MNESCQAMGKCNIIIHVYQEQPEHLCSLISTFTVHFLYIHKKDIPLNLGLCQSCLTVTGQKLAKKHFVIALLICEPRCEKTVFLHMGKQRRRSASG